jgi:hypothetical protein
MLRHALWLGLFVLPAMAFTEESTCRMAGDTVMDRCSLPYHLGTCLWLHVLDVLHVLHVLDVLVS